MERGCAYQLPASIEREDSHPQEVYTGQERGEVPVLDAEFKGMLQVIEINDLLMQYF